MSLNPFKKLISKTLILSEKDIDTDQIIPARFLTTTTREGLGQAAFYDWRYDKEGQMTESILNAPETKACQILVVGHNFGCGSSREHAPWALLDYGFRVVISTQIADIFKSNSLKNGLLPIIVEQEIHEKLLRDSQILTIDLDVQILVCEDGEKVSFDVEPFAKLCLLKGIDQLGFLLSHKDEIARYEERHR